MVIKSPAASAMRAKESAEAVLSSKSTGTARVVRLGGFKGQGGTRVQNGNLGGFRVQNELQDGMRKKNGLQANGPIVANSITKPATKPFQRVKPTIRSVSTSTISTRDTVVQSPSPAVRLYKEDKPNGFDNSKNRKKPKNPNRSTSSFYQKRGEAIATTRIGAKLSAIQAEFIPQVSFWKVVAISITAGAFGISYIHHGFQMQEQLNRVESLELQMERTRRVFTEKQIRYDRLTGPKEIYQKAQEAGFVSSGPANQSIPVRIETP